MQGEDACTIIAHIIIEACFCVHLISHHLMGVRQGAPACMHACMHASQLPRASWSESMLAVRAETRGACSACSSRLVGRASSCLRFAAHALEGALECTAKAARFVHACMASHSVPGHQAVAAQRVACMLVADADQQPAPMCAPALPEHACMQALIWNIEDNDTMRSADRPCSYMLLAYCMRLADAEALGHDVSPARPRVRM